MLKRTILMITSLALSIFAIAGCSTAKAEQPQQTDFKYVHDWSEPKTPEGAVRIFIEKSQREAAQTPVVEESVSEVDTGYYEAYTGYDESLNNNPQYLNFGDGFKSQGVREFNGRTETYYSSNVAYHYRTPEWTVDDEGYYRDDQGRYVVAASDVEQGSEIETSKGTGIVLDSGCSEGVTDFYVNFG